ncbi:MAG: hypothetical protein IJ642_13505 [Oscillospiraceae bacterium]|nr:hypothetical protein [Oscillospiraceae bacterium]
MTFYQLIRQISEILTPETDSFYDYVLHSCDDDGGFLRDRWCRWEKILPDFKVCSQEKTLICFRKPFHEGDAYYQEDDYAVHTLVKMQLFYDNGDIEDDIEWSRQLNYCFAYIIDLKNKSYTVTEYEPII